MQIVIVGAGIAGLSAYLFLHKHLIRLHPEQYHIVIYEAYDVRNKKHDAPGAQRLSEAVTEPLFKPNVIGNAIGISKNGISVLRRLDDTGEILKTVQAMGNGVTKWRMGTARGWKIIDANVQSTPKNGETSGTDTIMIARQVLWEVLRNQVQSIDANAIVEKKIVKIDNPKDGKVVLRFEDGTAGTADLLIGADGLRSTVRQTIFSEHNDVQSQSWLDWITGKAKVRKDYTTPHYEGLTGLGGFVPGSVLRETGFQQDAMSITFGPNGFFGHGYIGNVTHLSTTPETARREDSEPLAAWWSTFSSESPRPYQKAAETTTTDMATTFDRDRALQELFARHQSWVDPSIQAILTYVKENVNIEHIYPTYTTPELPNWTSAANNIIVIGDAAHTLQPSSGQGASQAMEDAETLALFLKHYLTHKTDQRTGVSMALQKTVMLRRPRVGKIYEVSQQMSRNKMNMGVIQEYVMYFFIWLSVRMGFMEKYNKELFEYDLPGEVEIVLSRAGK